MDDESLDLDRRIIAADAELQSLLVESREIIATARALRRWFAGVVNSPSAMRNVGSAR
jgi:hypothetical protein